MSFPLLRKSLLVLCTALALMSGLNFFYSPNHELAYHHWRMTSSCQANHCLDIYFLKIGNSGREDQSDVIVTLRTDPLKDSALPLRFTNFGVSEREVRQTEDESNGSTTIHLGNLKSGARTEMRIVLNRPKSRDALAWDEILLGIEPAEGSVIHADFELLRFGRFLAQILT